MHFQFTHPAIAISSINVFCIFIMSGQFWRQGLWSAEVKARKYDGAHHFVQFKSEQQIGQ